MQAVSEVRTPAARWHAVWTRSHCEHLVYNQLMSKGFHPYLPTIPVWTIRGGKRSAVPLLLFPGYVFLHDALHKAAYIEVRRCRGLVTVLGQRWDNLAVVPEREMAAVQHALSASDEARPHPYLREGEQVRITHGPLQGLEGFLLRFNSKKGFLVVSVHLLQRSLKVEVDCAAVKPL